MRINDYFNNATSIGFNSPFGVGALTNLVGSMFAPRKQNLPNNGGSYTSPTIAQPKAPMTPAPAPQFSPVGGEGTNVGNYTFQNRQWRPGTSTPPPPPAPGIPPTPPRIPPPNPDDLAFAINTAHSAINGRDDTTIYSSDAIFNPNASVEDMEGNARELNNARNDLASGATDPYGLGAGMALSPDEMRAVKKAAAGIYDPALQDVFKRISEAKSIASGSGGMGSNQMTDNERAAQTLFQNNQIVKDYNVVVTQKNNMDQVIKHGIGGPADLDTVFTFMKALDPNSVVRETEYANAAKSGNWFLGQFAKFNGYFKEKGGILPENVKQEFQNLINRKLAAQTATYQNYANQTKEIVARQGMNPDNVVIDFTGGVMQEEDDTSGMPQYPGYKYNPADGKYYEVSFNSVGGDTNQAIRIPQSSRLAYVNNNPGNLKYTKWTASLGAKPGANGFAKFSNPSQGLAAIDELTKIRAGQGHTLASYLNSYAPPSENDTNTYVRQIYQWTGINPNMKLSQLTPQQRQALIRAIARKESSTSFA